MSAVIGHARKLTAGAVLAVLACSPALAQMPAHDLRNVNTDAFPSSEWDVQAEAERLVIACAECDDFTAIDVQLLEADDTTEAGIRAGNVITQTMMEGCEANARDTSTECYGVRIADLKGAVGFVNDVKVFEGTYSNTYALYQDEILLLMRGVGASRDEARRVGDLAYRHIAPQIFR